MKHVTAIQTSDGQLFSDPFDAQVHQEILDSKDRIEEFMAHPDFPYRSVPQKAIARNVIAMWESRKKKGFK